MLKFNKKRFAIIIIIILFLLIIYCLSYIKLLKKEDIPIFIHTHGITKIIHQSWKNEKIPNSFDKYVKSFTEYCFKDWKYMLWTDEDNVNLIATHYPWFLNKYKELPTNIHRADVSRYFYLFHYGGLYTDLDNECLRPFNHLLMNYSIVFGAMEGQWEKTSLKEGYVQNSFMYSEPHHRFWLEMISHILKSPVKGIPELITGPVLLSNTIKSYRDRMGKLNDIIVYPFHYFNPFSWLNLQGSDKNCKTLNSMTNEEYQKCRSSMISKGSYVVQYHAHAW